MSKRTSKHPVLFLALLLILALSIFAPVASADEDEECTFAPSWVIIIFSGALDDFDIDWLEVSCNDDDPDATPEATPDGTPEATPEGTAEPGDGVIIIVEGPVTAININIITIFNDIEIEVNPDDLMLTVIQIGDVIRVEGVLDDDEPEATPEATPDPTGDITIVIIAINIIIIDVDVFILDGEIWRDPGNCSGGPPPWAQGRALGWHRRCDGGGRRGGEGSGSRS